VSFRPAMMAVTRPRSRGKDTYPTVLAADLIAGNEDPRG
jgi:hypothetical protein